ncbi:cell division control protein 2 homolog 3-like [Coccinella septempunctata]|uniref:cell division control protein 2 homolog 3-like n=1 Tax=Coccinella septempunctata TaxID=41139 RepID=UPI001D078AA0|nr:cell division control protein 2 homolog 3-like [Coccinella septempunctata]
MVPFNADEIREVQLLEGINRPNVVRLNEALVSPPDIYMVMPLYQGDLWDLTNEKRRRATVSGFYRILRQVAKDIAACHREHIVHRYLKPENVLHRGDRYVVADLGLARSGPPNRSSAPVFTGPQNNTGENHMVQEWTFGHSGWWPDMWQPV